MPLEGAWNFNLEDRPENLAKNQSAMIDEPHNYPTENAMKMVPIAEEVAIDDEGLTPTSPIVRESNDDGVDSLPFLQYIFLRKKPTMKKYLILNAS